MVGAVLAIIAVVTVMKFLPRRLAHQGAMRSPMASFEVSAELLGGMIPAMPDDLHRAEVAEAAEIADRSTGPPPRFLSSFARSRRRRTLTENRDFARSLSGLERRVKESWHG